MAGYSQLMDFRKNKLYKGAEKNLDFFLEDRVFNSSFFYKGCKKFCKIKLKIRGKICYNKSEENSKRKKRE